MNDVVVVIGSGGIGMAITRRQEAGKAVLIADHSETTLGAAAKPRPNRASRRLAARQQLQGGR